MEFDSQNELPDAGVFLAGRMNRTQVFGFNRIKITSMPRYEIIKQLGLLTRRASHNFLSHHRVGSEVQLLAYPIFNGDVWEKQKVRGSDLSSYPIRDLKDRFELKTSLPGAKAGHRRNQLGW